MGGLLSMPSRLSMHVVAFHLTDLSFGVCVAGMLLYTLL
jgi:hypothetical protein